MEEIQTKAVIEALVFVSESPVGLDSIREVLGDIPKKDLQRMLGEIIEEYKTAPRGFTLIEVGGGYQFRTRTEYAEWVKKLKKIKPFALSQPSLETLAILAYKQPVLRTEIEKIRGVDSGGVLRTLLEKKLIKILGKKDVPGKPLVYGTSKRFLEMFGLKDLSGLPTLKDLAGLGPLPPQEEVLPLEDSKTEKDETASGEEGTNSEGMGEKDELVGETSKDLG
ncbi:MAG: SMC-Scp complex subunit ScpB [Deltaproteobacteria bacterium]|nr:SMC-Scp complex subunit ScpB [Deltaproteobacteria bacterium]